MRRATVLVLAVVAGINSVIIRAAHAAPAVVAHVVDSLRGRVTANDDGAPVAAIVSLVEAGTGEVVARTRTALDGQYAIAVPPRGGAYVLRIVSIGYRPVVRRVEWAGGTWRAPGDVAMRPIEGDGGTAGYGVRATR